MILTSLRLRCLAFVVGVFVTAVGAMNPIVARAQFGSPNEDAKIILHVIPTVGGRPCSSTKARARCDEMKVNASIAQNYYAFVCVVDGKADAGIAGLQFGVKFNRTKRAGVDISEWTHCATLQFTYPGGRSDWYSVSNGGNLVTWHPENDCQRSEPSGAGTGVTAVAGYFYLTSYTADRLEITTRPVDNVAKVAACDAAETIVAGKGAPFRSTSYLGFVAFSDGGTVLGSNPCGLSRPVVETTWTGVKNSGR